MEKFRQFLGKYQHLHLDKAVHFVVGFLIALIAYIFIKDVWVCFGFAFIAGLYKEFSDHLKYGNGGYQTYLDWFATMAGGALMAILFG